MLLRVLTVCDNPNPSILSPVITSTHESDDAIERVGKITAFLAFAATLDESWTDIIQAARHFQAAVIVRITADCPLLDPIIVDKVCERF